MGGPMTWTHERVPRLDGRTIIVTGANSGLGLESSRMLSERGAHVIMACRDPSKVEGPADVRRLDLASLESVREFVASVGQVDVLVNNAGVMACPRRKTGDGFEMHLGTNHFGPFALTMGLLPKLATDGRVVTVASTMHRGGRMMWDDLDGDGGYEKWSRYSQSKLANLLFTFALARRFAGSGRKAVAAHPGYAATNLQSSGVRMGGAWFEEGMMKVGNAVFAQSARWGAWPTVLAAAGEVENGDYIGPAWLGTWGPPVKASCSAAAKREEDQEKLWQVSEERTGVRFP